MNAGIILSVLINLIFSKTMQEIIGFDPGVEIFWIWLNFTGFALCVIITYVVSVLFKDKDNKVPDVKFEIRKKDILTKESVILVLFFIVIVIFSLYVPQIFG